MPETAVTTEAFEVQELEPKAAMARPVVMSADADAVEFTQAGFFLSVFSFFTTPAGKALLMARSMSFHAFLPLQVFWFPIAALLEVAECIIAFVQLVRADNKNVGKTINLLTKLAKSSIIVAAVIMGVVATIVGVAALTAVIPYLFVAALSLNVIFNVATSLYHTVKMLKAPRGSELRKAHRQALIHTVIGVVFAVVLVGAVTALFAAGVSTPVGLGIVAGIGIATVVGMMTYAIVKKYIYPAVKKHRAKKKAEKVTETTHNAKREQEVNPQEEADNPSETTPLIQQKTVQRQSLDENAPLIDQNLDNIVEASHAPGDRKDRLYVRDIDGLLARAEREGGDKCKRFVFKTLLDAKINTLNAHIQKEQDKSSWVRFFTGEATKRQAKVDGLNELKQILFPVTKSGQSQSLLPAGATEAKVTSLSTTTVLELPRLPIKDIRAIVFRHPRVFQSFKKDKGDTEVLFDAATKYFAVS